MPSRADLIRKMTDEDLKNFIEWVYLDHYPAQAGKQTILEWLQEEYDPSDPTDHLSSKA